MEVIKKLLLLSAVIGLLFFFSSVFAKENPPAMQPMTQSAMADALGWKQTGENRCGGYYVEPAISSKEYRTQKDIVQIVSNQFLYSFHGPSESQGKIIIRRYGQEITADKAYLYPDPKTGKLKNGAIDLIGNVTLREPNTLVLAQRGQFDFQKKAPSLLDILYRTTIYGEASKQKGIKKITAEETEHERKIDQLSAWGKAHTFNQEQPKIYTMNNASYTTCPPTECLWKVEANHIEINKITGRGSATHARLLVHDIPIFYTPYINFPIDSRRKSGFLWPMVGLGGKQGPFISTPYYWDIAPNYDMTITPAILFKRGFELTDLFRYLTSRSEGEFKASILPNDKAFAERQKLASQNNSYIHSTDPYVQAELRRLLNAGTLRGAFTWNDKTQFNDHWSSNVDYSYVSDDYYPRDLITNINEVTENQLLQKADMTYKGQYWNFTGRVQSYQTLHPINTSGTFVNNQYSRFPQFILNGDYPDNKFGFEYAINNELTRFDIRNTPGNFSKQPMGVRTNVQPAISYPLNTPYLTLTPRLQFAMTQYELGHVNNHHSKAPSRTLPIFDVNSELFFDRDLKLFDSQYTQTLEPRVYYTYIPYRNQNQIPIFDTITNQLTYDQLFLYNRFSGIDRIGDTSQVAMGFITRFIDQRSGYEKFRAGIGQIYYFKNRLVTVCNSSGCTDNPADPNSNLRNRSPISALIKYHLSHDWSADANTIWDPLAKSQKLTNQTVGLRYHPDSLRLISFNYTFAKDGDKQYPSIKINSASNNLSQTDLSAIWPLTHNYSGVVRWTQNLNRHNFQNLLFGVQYDSCCWAVRVVAGKEFVGINPNNNTLQYNPLLFIQFALKGLGNLGTGDPTQMLMNSVSGYQTQFGQDY